MSQDAEQQESEQTTDVAVPDEESVAVEFDPLARFGVAIPENVPVTAAMRQLDIGGSVAFALDVARIDRAEKFYHDVFEMDIVCRAWRRDDGSWETTTEEINWPEQLMYGEYPQLVVLQRPGWTIVLHGMGRGEVLTSPKTGDAEVLVTPETMRRLRARILMKAYTVVHDSPNRFAFRDPYGVVWTLVEDESLSPPS